MLVPDKFALNLDDHNGVPIEMSNCSWGTSTLKRGRASLQG
jgi:hypothetical protein